ncbi:MAG: hypothetical protein MI976_12790 [Pseudomonadales bacterium]|nr:hypothetical protein [Pseudomonadales bacterium]
MKALSSMMLATGLLLTSGAQAVSVWVVESGQDPFSNSEDKLILNEGVTTLDLYYDTEGDTSYGYDFQLLIDGVGSINNVHGGDSGLGSAQSYGWRQFGGDILGESGYSVLAFSFDFFGEVGSVLTLGGSYTNGSFIDEAINSNVLAEVAPVPLPASALLFASALLGGLGLKRKKKN